MDLKGFRNKAKAFSDLLPYAIMVEPGIVMGKDGTFMAGWEIAGEDTASCTAAELEYVSMQFSAAIQRLGTGWMLHINAIRTKKKAYPPEEASHFSDPVSSMMDRERRKFFGSDVCFETATYIVVTYMPNYNETKLSSVAVSGEKKTRIHERALKRFIETISAFEDTCNAVVKYMIRLEDMTLYDAADQPYVASMLLSHLKNCIHGGNVVPVRLPDPAAYLDAYLADRDLIGGSVPRLEGGDYPEHIIALAIEQFPFESYPAMFAALDQMPFELRYSIRFIALDQYDAEKELTMHVKGWNQKAVSTIDQLTGKANPKVNRDAVRMREDAETAKLEVQSGEVSVGFFTSNIILMNSDYSTIEDEARALRRQIESQGFTCRIESINALEAWLGTLPGVWYANVRRPMFNSLNLADLAPLQSVWTGTSTCPCPFYPAGSPALAVVMTDGSTPFWFNLHQGDLGHTLICGPTGAGKSTLLSFIAMSFRRYEGGRVYAFDKGLSMYPACMAVGGNHYEIGGDSDICFAPLQHVSDSVGERMWCESWVCSLIELQGIAMTPHQKTTIHDAIMALTERPENMRTLSHFMDVVQDIQLRQALQFYTQRGSLGPLVDATEDNLKDSQFLVFETEELMKMDDRARVPVLMYLFHRFDNLLKGEPALLILDEAWVMLGNSVFRAKIREWLKVLRKANCAVILATQSISDAASSGIMDVLMESCPTKIWLPNREAKNDEFQEFYRKCGLNERQIQIVARATPKRDYYLVTPSGRRLIQLALGKIALSFVGVSDKIGLGRIKDLVSAHGADWYKYWLSERNVVEL